MKITLFKKSDRLYIYILVVALAVACIPQDYVLKYNLTLKEFDELTLKADSGDKKALKRLTLYYMYCIENETMRYEFFIKHRLMPKEQLFTQQDADELERRVEQGDAEAFDSLYRYYTLVVTDREKSNKFLAKYHLTDSYFLTQEEIDELMQKAEKWDWNAVDRLTLYFDYIETNTTKRDDYYKKYYSWYKQYRQSRK